MIRKFSIEKFRCFKDFEINNLERINIITGRNNVGKTALLEALWLAHGYHNPQLGFRLGTFRGFDIIRKDKLLDDLFTNFDLEDPIVFSWIDQKENRFSLEITKKVSLDFQLSNGKTSGTEIIDHEDGSPEETQQLIQAIIHYKFSDGSEASTTISEISDKVKVESNIPKSKGTSIFLSSRNPGIYREMAERFGDLQVDNKHKIIEKALKIIEPRLKSLFVRYAAGTGIIYGDLGDPRPIPLYLLGDGVVRFLNISLAIPTARNGAVMIDEIDNGFHHSIMGKVWEAIRQLAFDFNVQIFTTTHSKECILSAYKTFFRLENSSYGVFRLAMSDSKIQAHHFDNELLETAFEIDAEVR
jgi:AAA15 family ATPase/GTPase